MSSVATGLAAAALTSLLQFVQHAMWPGPGTLLDAAGNALAWRRVLVLLLAGAVTGVGQLALRRLSSGNSIDITAAIWFHAGRLPPLRTLGSAILSVVIVGMGASLGREGAPKQAGAVAANFLCDRVGLSDEQRRLVVACGAGAGMAAAYGVPLGGALFAIEVLRGALSLRLVLPAMMASLIATAVSWLALPNAVTYPIPDYPAPLSIAVWALVAGPIAGIVSVGYVRAIAWADHHKPKGWRRLLAPTLALGSVGLLSIWFPELLGNGKDLSELLFTVDVPFASMLALLLLRPLATLLCLGSGAPGGLFTRFADDGGAARRRARSRLVVDMAWRSRGRVRGGRRRGRARRDDPGAHLVRRADDGTDRTRPFVHRAVAIGSRHRDAGFAHDRAAFDL